MVRSLLIYLKYSKRYILVSRRSLSEGYFLILVIPETGRTGVNIVIVARIVVMRLLMMGPSAHRVHMISEGLKY